MWQGSFGKLHVFGSLDIDTWGVHTLRGVHADPTPCPSALRRAKWKQNVSLHDAKLQPLPSTCSKMHSHLLQDAFPVNGIRVCNPVNNVSAVNAVQRSCMVMASAKILSKTPSLEGVPYSKVG